MHYADLNFMEEKETTGRGGRQSQAARAREDGADANAGGLGMGKTGKTTTNGAEDGSRSSDEETFVDVTANGGQGGAGAIGARGGGVGRRAAVAIAAAAGAGRGEDDCGETGLR